MKALYLILKILPVILIMMLFNVNPGCKDPSEFQPTDSLIPPPDQSPQLLFPPDDTGWVLIPNPGYINVTLSWSSVPGTEFYELEIANEGSFASGVTYTTSYTTHTVTFTYPRHCYWHVRAGSSAWTWYTNWSDARYFRIAPPIK